jgi:acyl dehydratase
MVAGEQGAERRINDVRSGCEGFQERALSRLAEPVRSGTLAPMARSLTQDRLTAYSEDSANALRGQSIHVQPEVAKKAGFPTTLAQGLMGADYMSELMENELGREWYDYSKLSVAFLRPVLCGDEITATGRLAEAAEDGAMIRRTYELWCENQRKELVTSAIANCLVGRS